MDHWATGPQPRGHHSAVRAGGSATPTGYAARAGVEATHALTFNPDHSLGADHQSGASRKKFCKYGGFSTLRFRAERFAEGKLAEGESLAANSLCA